MASRFRTELGLVRQFVRRLRSSESPWGKLQVSREFDYQRGRVDILALSEGGNYLIAFEAKLERWRHALHQAYRNRCLAHASYVLLPKEAALLAQKHEAEFTMRNVGLCCLDEGVIVLILAPKPEPPLEPWLFREAAQAGGRRFAIS